jgi:hypothetical protein
MNNSKIIWSAVVVVAIIAIIGTLTPFRQQLAGAINTAFTNIGVTQLSVGTGCGDSNTSCNGTAVNRLNIGTCYIAPYAATISASSTVSVDCQGTLAWNALGTSSATSALTGVSSGDAVQITLSTTTAGSTVAGLKLGGASASTTSGHIELRVTNLTGTTYTWSTTAGIASGTAYYISSN